jgi:hypothetical protein
VVSVLTLCAHPAAAARRRHQPDDAGGPGALGEAVPLRYLTSMPFTKVWASSDINVVIARVAPEILALLAESVPRTKTTIVAALADRHPKDDVQRTLMRLAVTEQLVETGGKYSLPRAEAGQG